MKFLSYSFYNIKITVSKSKFFNKFNKGAIPKTSENNE